MPARRRSTRRPKRKAVRRPRRRVQRKAKKSVGSNYASCVEVVEDFHALQPNEGFGLVGNLSVGPFARAKALSKVYKYYRLDKVEVEWIPYYNTFQASADASTVGIPELYACIDRTLNAGRTPTLLEMQERGIRPILMKRGAVKKSFKPSALQMVNLEVTASNLNTVTTIDEINHPGQTIQSAITGIGVQNSTPIFNKWFLTQQTTAATYGNQGSGGAYPGLPDLVPPATNPLSLNYYGMIWYIAQVGATSNKDFGKVLVRYHWSFKGPRSQYESVKGTMEYPIDLSGSSLRPSNVTVS